MAAPPILAPQAAQPVLPTTKNRIHTLDALRGFAVLGILLANIMAFGEPILADMLRIDRWILTPAEQWLEAWHHLLVSGKFRGALCIMFGVGLWLQFRKREAAGAWPNSFLKRMGLLALLGAMHGLFLWFGDVLFVYGVAGFIAALMMRIDETKMIKVAAWLIVIGSVMGFLTMLGGSVPPDQARQLSQQVPAVTIAGETQLYAQGSYLWQLAMRAALWFLNLFNLPILLPTLIGLFLVGVTLARKGVLSDPGAHPKIMKVGSLVGIFGVLGSSIPLIMQATGTGDPSLFGMVVDMSFAQFAAIGYVLWASWLFHKLSPGGWLRGLENVGRIALTTYLSQTVICTFLFYSYGLGWFGSLDRFQLLQVVAGVWAWNLIFAAAWLKFFDIGPVEWVWRSAVEGRKLPWRTRGSESDAAA